MTSTEATTATITIVTWGEQEIHLTSTGEAYTPRWTSATDCTEGFACTSCWRDYSPGYEFTRQGTTQEWSNNVTSGMRAELAELKRKLEQEYILIETVQQVGSDYAQQEEWCRVYEEAFTHLTTPYYPNGIPTLDKSSRVRVTITVEMDVTASRRQRAGDEDFMRESLAMSRIRNAVQYLDPFDDDYEAESGEVMDVSVEIID